MFDLGYKSLDDSDVLCMFREEGYMTAREGQHVISAVKKQWNSRCTVGMGMENVTYTGALDAWKTGTTRFWKRLLGIRRGLAQNVGIFVTVLVAEEKMD